MQAGLRDSKKRPAYGQDHVDFRRILAVTIISTVIPADILMNTLMAMLMDMLCQFDIQPKVRNPDQMTRALDQRDGIDHLHTPCYQ